MKKKTIITKTLAILLLSLFTITLFYSHMNEVQGATEDLYINNSAVTHYGSSDIVTIPTEYTQYISEMRGMWIATVWNADIRATNSVETFKNNYISILDVLEQYNFNTVFFQIRPNNDAFYISDLNPWSRWMTGSQGVALYENGEVFDPLKWVIEVTHERGMQLIGWMNAYRVSYSNLFSDSSNNYTQDRVASAVERTLNSLNDKSFAKKNPRYCLVGDDDSKLILNPGESAVQNFLIDTVREIVTKYDIDGVHFDDYFYLDSTNSASAEVVVNTASEYANADTAFNNYYNDYQTYLNNRLSNETLANFRRRSVNIMIEGISKAIDEVNETFNKDVQFGSKPAGVWTSQGRSVDGRIEGANVHPYAYSSYSDIYADSLYWAEQGWIDWISPQVYYNFVNNEVPYADIVKWWGETITTTNEALLTQGKKPVKLYIAHGFYRMDPGESTSGKYITDSTEIAKQLLYNQKFTSSWKGSAFYNFSTFKSTTTSVVQARAELDKIWLGRTLPYITTGSSDVVKSAQVVDNKLQIAADDNVRIFMVHNKPLDEDIILNGKVTDLVDEEIALYYNSDKGEDGFITIDIDPNNDYYVTVIDKNYSMSKISYLVGSTPYQFYKVYTGKTIELPQQIDGTDVTYQNTSSLVEVNGNTVKGIGEGKAVLEAVDSNNNILANIIIDILPVYQVNYNADNGTLPADVISEYYPDEKIDLPIPTRTGYGFLGWYDAKDMLVSDTTLYRGTLNLTAKWKQLSRYTATISEGEGYTTDANLSLRRIFEGETLIITINILEGYTGSNILVMVNNDVAKLDGYTLTIENVTSDLKIEIFGVRIDNTPKQYEVTLKYLDVTETLKVTEGEDVTFPVVEGYTITWDSDGKNITSNQVINGTAAIKTYQVKFIALENEFIQTVNHGSSAVVPNIEVEQGYEFVGYIGDFTNITADTTIEIEYRLVKIFITYQTNSTMNEVVREYNVGEVITPDVNPTKSGHRFVGWYLDEACTETLPDNFIPEGPLTLYAKYEQTSNCFSGSIIYTVSILGLIALVIRRKSWLK